MLAGAVSYASASSWGLTRGRARAPESQTFVSMVDLGLRQRSREAGAGIVVGLHPGRATHHLAAAVHCSVHGRDRAVVDYL